MIGVRPAGHLWLPALSVAVWGAMLLAIGATLAPAALLLIIGAAAASVACRRLSHGWGRASLL